MTIIIVCTAGVSILAGIILGVILNEIIRYKIQGESKYKFWNMEGAYNSDLEKY